MAETGKIDRSFFEEYLATRLGASRADVLQGPAHGVDFGVIDAGRQALVVATDPISILPELGFERAGRFATRIVLADVAVSGISPTHLSVSFSLPPSMSDEAFASFWAAVDAECRDLGVQIVTGHTARYEGCQFPWVGHGTALGMGAPDEIIYPDGAEVGDKILVTNGPAVEATALFANLFPEQIPVSETALQTAQEYLDEIGAVRDALTASATGRVTAIHDATEGGVLGAAHEMTTSAGLRFALDSAQIPQPRAMRKLCDALDMDPWRATSAGTLLITVEAESVDEVVSALESRGTSVGVAGRVEAGSGVTMDGNGTEPPTGDSSWPVYERLLEGSEEM